MKLTLSELENQAQAWAKDLRAGDVVWLDGPMGAGKSTLTRMFLKALGIDQASQGSPTFALAHEYRVGDLEVIHMDLYRLEHEEELEDAGLEASVWERNALVFMEWGSKFPSLRESLTRLPQGRRVIEIQLGFCDEDPGLREVAKSER